MISARRTSRFGAPGFRARQGPGCPLCWSECLVGPGQSMSPSFQTWPVSACRRLDFGRRRAPPSPGRCAAMRVDADRPTRDSRPARARRAASRHAPERDEPLGPVLGPDDDLVVRRRCPRARGATANARAASAELAVASPHARGSRRRGRRNGSSSRAEVLEEVEERVAGHAEDIIRTAFRRSREEPVLKDRSDGESDEARDLARRGAAAGARRSRPAGGRQRPPHAADRRCEWNDAIPPGNADHAARALKESPRHGEWVDIKLPDGRR